LPDRDSLARKTFVVTSVAILTLAGFLALWKLKVLVALLFLSFMLASAMRPGVERMVRVRVPRIGGVLAHYAVFAGLLALVLWFVVPQMLHQVEYAIGNVPQTSRQLGKAAKQTTGIKHDILVGLQKELKKLPHTGNVVHAAVDAGRKAVEIFVGIFFVLAAAAYWIYERERAEQLVVSLLPNRHRKKVKDTWDLVELKLGAYVRASLLLIGFVGTVLSLAFWAIGLPYWLLLGLLAAVLEIIPIVGPLLAGIASVGVALTVSVEAAILTAIAVYGLRLLQDYLIQPKVMGNTIGIAPLAILVVVTAVGLLFGAVFVPLAVPITAVAATLADVLIRGKEPSAEEVPTVLFGSGDLKEYQEETERKARKAERARSS
jgi:predicted PurR-regulated permease PerM